MIADRIVRFPVIPAEAGIHTAAGPSRCVTLVLSQHGYGSRAFAGDDGVEGASSHPRPRHPGGSWDPYRGRAVSMRNVGFVPVWVWVPAFAGTTVLMVGMTALRMGPPPPPVIPRFRPMALS